VADVNPLAYRFHLADVERQARPAGRVLPRPAPLPALLRALARDIAALAQVVGLARPIRSS
jgi:hypothetical protein